MRIQHKGDLSTHLRQIYTSICIIQIMNSFSSHLTLAYLDWNANYLFESVYT